jgi:hypothetical protein
MSDRSRRVVNTRKPSRASGQRIFLVGLYDEGGKEIVRTRQASVRALRCRDSSKFSDAPDASG